MKVKVLNSQGKETSKTVELADSIYGIEPNDHAIYLDVKQYLANQRQGTHKSKERAEIAGSTRKIKRQKGTGTARAGSIKSPTRVGGGRAFGPRPRSYYFKLNKKVKRLARASALTYKAKASNILVVEDLKIEQPKTKEFIGILNGLKLSNSKTLIIVGEHNENMVLSSRNIKKATVKTVSEISTYEIMNAGTIVLAESSVGMIEKNLN